MRDRSLLKATALRGVMVTLLALATVTGCSSGGGTTADSAEGGTSEAAGETGEEKEEGTGNVVTLTEVSFATARITVEPVRGDAAGTMEGGFDVPGQVEFDPARVALVSPRASGRIERLLVVPLQRVSAGQPVALLHSPAFITAQIDLLQAKRRAGVLAGTADAEGGQALLTAARRRLELLGVGSGAIEQIEAGGEPSRFLAVTAPFDGSIVEANALAGAAVEAGTPLFKIADVSVVNVGADVPERTLGSVRVGQGATIRVPAFPTTTFAGRITSISDQLDPTTRTAEALIQVTNTNRTLRPGMSATVTLRVPGATTGRSPTAITIPASAVIADGDARYVFVQTGPYTYERRAVRLGTGVAPGSGPTSGFGSRVIILEGLTAGEQIVTQGAFTLNSELGKASFAEEEEGGEKEEKEKKEKKK